MTRFGWVIVAVLSLALVWALVTLPSVSVRACYESKWTRPPDLHWPKQNSDLTQRVAVR